MEKMEFRVLAHMILKGCQPKMVHYVLNLYYVFAKVLSKQILLKSPDLLVHVPLHHYSQHIKILMEFNGYITYIPL